jgi:cytochrome d ubiquinol oxidase subunit II
LILHGISIEFRNHIEGPAWAPLWDVVFSFSSLLLAVCYGAALGNVVRGVPLDAKGYFFEPLWTNFRLGPESGILDWYTLLAGLTAFWALGLHGALWVAAKTEGAVNERCGQVAGYAWWGAAAFTAVLTYFTFRVQPQVSANLYLRPWGYVLPALALAGLLSARRYIALGEDLKAFFGSCAYLLGMLTSVVFGLYPYVLPASTNPAYALSVHNAKAADYGLRIGLVWWIIGMVLAAAYFVFLYRHFAGKVKPEGEGY